MAAAVLLAACGSDDGNSADAASDTSDSGTSVTIEHPFGETTIDADADDFVTIGGQWTDVMLAMDVQPVGYGIDPMTAADNGQYPWQDGLLDDSTGLEVADGLPLEQIAALNPDVILIAPYLIEDQAAFDTLTAIAPTVASISDNQVDHWQDMVELAGEFLGEPERAQAVLDDAEALLAETATELPGLEGKTFAMVNYVPGDAIHVVADPEDGSSVFFQSLGMALSPDLVAAADGVSGRAELSLEQVGLLDADLLVVFANGADPSDLVGFDQLPAVTSGAVSDMDYDSVVGLNTPTPLSIPYSLDVVRPALEAAAG